MEQRARVPVQVMGGENDDDPVYVAGDIDVDLSDLGDVTLEDLTDCLVTALKVMEYEHHEIHEGAFYIVSDVNLTLGSGATFIIGASIPADTFAHFRFAVSAGGATHVELIENAQLSGGAALTIYNANRNGPAAPFGALTDPTVGGGTVILEYILATGGGPKAAGGEGGIASEIITQDSLDYAIRCTNLTNGNIAISIDVGFYTKHVAICP